MKLEVGLVSKTRNGGPQAESAADRVARMTAFWADPKNATVVRIGRLFKMAACGQEIAEGGVLELPEVVDINGVRLKVSNRNLSLKTEDFRTWHCPACASAHGSGVAPSREISSKLLDSCQFYYNPSTQRVFTISSTCLDTYCEALGASSHIIDLEDYKFQLAEQRKQAKHQPQQKAEEKTETK